MDEIFGGKWIQMKKIDSVVLRETGYIALWVLIFSVLMEAVFLVTGYFDYTVPLGNLLGAAATVLNFFLMGLTGDEAVADSAYAYDTCVCRGGGIGALL